MFETETNIWTQTSGVHYLLTFWLMITLLQSNLTDPLRVIGHFLDVRLDVIRLDHGRLVKSNLTRGPKISQSVDKHTKTGISAWLLLLWAIMAPYLTVQIMRLHREQILSCWHNENWASVSHPGVEDGGEDGHTHTQTNSWFSYLSHLLTSLPDIQGKLHLGWVCSVSMTLRLDSSCSLLPSFYLASRSSTNPATTSDRPFDLWLQFPCADAQTQAALPTLYMYFTFLQ